MISYSEYYEKSLYPLQDGVLNSVGTCRTQFYLTGGTALSRGYYNHRYSDDLDFFVNSDSTFGEQVNIVLDRLRQDGFIWSMEKDYFRTVDFCTLKVGRADSEDSLKLDFVNDVSPHFGEITGTTVYSRTDSIRNILANKVTALFRFEGKDAADVREIARHYSFNWIDVVLNAREKEAGLELPIVAEILKGIPRVAFDTIRWVRASEWEDFVHDIDIIVRDMLAGSDNSLVL